MNTLQTNQTISKSNDDTDLKDDFGYPRDITLSKLKQLMIQKGLTGRRS